jgi:hypothetical protein
MTSIETMNIEVDSPSGGDGEAAATWTIVSQVKSYRVVYFTDDPGYAPAAEGDWYYVSTYHGDLPKGMSLRNCWRWRFNGASFVDAGKAAGRSTQETLHQRNRDALTRILHDKVAAMRQPYSASCAMGEVVRQRKLSEARLFASGAVCSEGDLPYLVGAAAVRDCSISEMAELVIARHEECEEVLRESELLRERFALEIRRAASEQELAEIRVRLIEELAPDLNKAFAIKPEHTTPGQHKALLSDLQVRLEQGRLRVQLRERINALRRVVVSAYLLDDVVLKHKGRIAQAVIASGGAVPSGVDALPLISHAAATGQSVAHAAREVLAEMSDTARVLLETEQMKDSFLSRIAAVRSFADVKAIGAAIASLSLHATGDEAVSRSVA